MLNILIHHVYVMHFLTRNISTASLFDFLQSQYFALPWSTQHIAPFICSFFFELCLKG